MPDNRESGDGFRREPSISNTRLAPPLRNQARGSLDLIVGALRDNLEPKFDTRRSNDLPEFRRKEANAAVRLSLEISRLSVDIKERYCFTFSVGSPLH